MGLPAQKTTKIVDIRLVEKKKPKLRKDGCIKQTKNNVSHDQFVEPIREVEDIKKIDEYLRLQIDNAICSSKEYMWLRNRMLFITGITVGLRVNDLLMFTWDLIMNSDMKTFKKQFVVKEMKTGKIKRMYITKEMENAFNEFLLKTKTKPNKGCYIFTKTNGVQITDECVSKFIKKVTSECNIYGNYNTHSLRKTMAYRMYITLIDQCDPLALAKVQKFLNHRNQSDTLRYLGLYNGMEEDIINDMYENIF